MFYLFYLMFYLLLVVGMKLSSMNMIFILMIFGIKQNYYFDPYNVLFGYCHKYIHATCDWFCDHKLRQHLAKVEFQISHRAHHLNLKIGLAS